MSFDGGGNASTLDDYDFNFGFKSHRAPPVRRAAHADAATVAADLVPMLPTRSIESTLQAFLASGRSCTIDGDFLPLRDWLVRTKRDALVEFVAAELSRHMGGVPVRAALETEEEEPDVQRILLVAAVRGEESTDLERYFEFIASPWWLSVVQRTHNAIVIDIEHARP